MKLNFMANQYQRVSPGMYRGPNGRVIRSAQQPTARPNPSRPPMQPPSVAAPAAPPPPQTGGPLVDPNAPNPGIAYNGGSATFDENASQARGAMGFPASFPQMMESQFAPDNTLPGGNMAQMPQTAMWQDPGFYQPNFPSMPNWNQPMQQMPNMGAGFAPPPYQGSSKPPKPPQGILSRPPSSNKGLQRVSPGVYRGANGKLVRR